MKARCFSIFIGFLVFAVSIGAQSPGYKTKVFHFKGDRVGQFEYRFEQVTYNGIDPLQFRGEDRVHWIQATKDYNKLYLIIKNLRLENQSGRKLSHFKLAIHNPSCVTTSGVVKHNLSNHFDMKSGAPAMPIIFEIVDNGTGELRVGFDVVKKRDHSSTWKCNVGEIVLKLKAEGFKVDTDGDDIDDSIDNCPKHPNPNQADSDSDDVGDECDNCPFVSNTNQKDLDGDSIGDACDIYENQDDTVVDILRRKWEEVDKTSLNELCSFWLIYKNSVLGPKARKAIRALDQKAWRTATTKNTTKAYRDYLKYLDKCQLRERYAKTARQKIGALDLSKKWEGLKKGMIEENIVSFFKEHGDYKSEVLFFIKENFPSLNPIMIEVESNRKYRVRIQNDFFYPRYKDISLKKGIIIDNSKWLESRVLAINLTQSGTYRIQVKDTIGRDTLFVFGYQFRAKETIYPKEYNIKINGGSPPFQVALYDESNSEKWKRTFEDRDIILSKETFVKQGLEGNFKVSVKHSYDQMDELILSEELVLEKSKLILILTILILLISVLLFSWFFVSFLQKRKKKNRIIIHTYT